MPLEASNSIPGEVGAAAVRAQTIRLDDAACIQQVRTGQMHAFGMLVSKYQDRVFNVVYRIVGHRAEAEELAQEIFLRALERLSQFSGQSSFYTWLFRIATNIALTHLRRAGRIRFRSLQGPDGATIDLADQRPDDDPAQVLLQQERAARVAGALEELDDDYRAVIVLREIEQMDYAMIAEVLDLPVGTVRSRLHRARAILRESLADLLK